MRVGLEAVGALHDPSLSFALGSADPNVFGTSPWICKSDGLCACRATENWDRFPERIHLFL